MRTRITELFGIEHPIVQGGRNTERVLNNKSVEKLIACEKRLGDSITFEDIKPYVAGVYPKVMQDGDIAAHAS